MPAKSKKQERFMQAVANNPKFAKKVGVPQSVGEEFMDADRKMPMPKKRPSKMAPKRAAMPRPRPSMEDREMQDTLDRGESSSRYEAEDMMIPKMAKGGGVKTHMMPDGTKMKGASHGMKGGGKVRSPMSMNSGPGDRGRAKIRAAKGIASKSKDYENEGTISGLRSEGSRLLGQEYGRKIGDVGEPGYYAKGGMTKAYKEGGKVRGYGKARGGKTCKMM